MSNIRDITSLSDLLATSPSQPLHEPSSNKSPASTLNLAASILVKKTAEDSTSNNDAEEELDESEIGDRTIVSDSTETPQKDKVLAESQSQSISRNTTESQLPQQLTPEIVNTDKIETSEQSTSVELSNVEILLSKQSEKISLQDELKDKVRQCSDLKATVEDLRARIKYLKEQKRRKDNKRTLELLLEENNNDYNEGRVHQDETQTMLNEEDDEDYILKNLNVLPSNDWGERLDQIRRFVPYLELDNIGTSNFYSTSNELQRVIQFVLLSPLLFKIPFKLVINARDETLTEIILQDSSASIIESSPLTTLSMLSTSLKHTIVRNYIPKKKINLIVFGLSSLSMLIHRRISTFYNLMRTFSSILRDRKKFSSLLSEQELQDNIQLFAMLKSIDNLEFLVEKNNIHYVLRLTWQVKLQNKITAECASDLRLHVFVIDDAHDDELVKSADALFTKLINEYGVINSFKIVLENTFNITVDEKTD
ncbi:hypothetical protein G9P44_003599 [Scheffersomyces stipitis]|nr:hypothetical protein G9P44_003599 [Scheffersomyces stipitis]